MSDFDALRRAEFPWTRDTIYLNAASTGPLPERARRVLDDWTRRRTMPHLLSDSTLMGVLAESRDLLARLLNAGSDEIALATNTSWGLNVAAASLPLEAGDVVLVSDREFPANVYPWFRLRQRGVVVELAPVTAAGWPDEAHLVERVRDPRVKVLAVSLVQFSTGYAVDLDRLSRVTRETGTWLVVDAIQGLGNRPLDLQKTPVDLLAAAGQKWLLSPWGTGFVYVRRELVQRLLPPFAGWMAFEGTDDYTRLTRYSDTWRDDARRFESVTLPYQDFAALTTSLAMLLDCGVPAIAAHARACQEPLVDWAHRRRVPVTSPLDDHRSAIVCVAPPDPVAAHAALAARGIHVSLREGSLRLSPHIYNTVDEMERVVAALEAVLRAA